jgi:hypothetical protein
MRAAAASTAPDAPEPGPPSAEEVIGENAEGTPAGGRA